MFHPGKLGRRGLCAVVFAGVLATTPAAMAMPRIYIPGPPPAPIVEVRPTAPSRRHIWVEGYHRWDGRAYVWTPGRWSVGPRGRHGWVAGHYAHTRRGYYWVPGHWRR